MAAPLKVGIAGLGTVGTSVVRLIAQQREALATRCGRPIEVVAVCARSRGKKRGIDLGNSRWVASPVDLAADREIDVFVELIGGEGDPAKAAVAAALAAENPWSPPTRRCSRGTASRSPPLAEKNRWP